MRQLARACTIGLLACSESQPDATRDPVFDWFEYAGNDSALVGGDSTTYHNPILAGFAPDPSITRAGDNYYLVTSSFSYYPGVPVWHSRDLVTWSRIGDVLDRASQLSFDTSGVSRGIFAPTIRHHDGTFYMITTVVDQGGNFVVTATNPAGPWSDPAFLGFDGIDPDLFFDDDGRAWVLNNGPPNETPRYEGHRAIWIQEFDPKTKTMIGPRTQVVNGGVDLSKRPIWIEAPHVFKVDGWYYLICAEGGTADQHSEVVFRSRNVTGPYTPYADNPILTQRHLDSTRSHPVTSTGHADFVQLPDGTWWAVFLGTRPYRGDYYNTGRETFLLPVQWRDGWPHILDDKTTVPYVHPRPNLPRQPAARVPTQGNFTWRDEFTDSTLDRTWRFLRTPKERWYSLTRPPGALSLVARPAPITERTQPSFVARPLQHLNATATVSMRYLPERDGDRAGLVAFQNEGFHFFVGVAMVGGARVVTLEQVASDSTGGGTRTIASVPLPAGVRQTWLRMEAHGERYAFSWADRDGDWHVMAENLDGTILSTRRARGFVGTMIGMYAQSARHLE